MVMSANVHGEEKWAMEATGREEGKEGRWSASVRMSREEESPREE